MIIKPSTILKNNYNEITTFCKEKKQPVFLTKDGEKDLVIMSIEYYVEREAMLDLREKLLKAEAAYLSGGATYTVEEVSKRLKVVI